LKKALALGVAGGVSLLALAMAAPGESLAKRGEVARAAVAAPTRSIGTFTPAVRDPASRCRACPPQRLGRI
jgi:hypothetical protein